MLAKMDLKTSYIYDLKLIDVPSLISLILSSMIKMNYSLKKKIFYINLKLKNYLKLKRRFIT